LQTTGGEEGKAFDRASLFLFSIIFSLQLSWIELTFAPSLPLDQYSSSVVVVFDSTTGGGWRMTVSTVSCRHFLRRLFIDVFPPFSASTKSPLCSRLQ
jgi:hypothetical protein